MSWVSATCAIQQNSKPDGNLGRISASSSIADNVTAFLTSERWEVGRGGRDGAELLAIRLGAGEISKFALSLFEMLFKVI